MAPQGAAAPSGPRARSTKRMSLHDFRALVAESKAPGKALSEKSFVAKYGYGYDACILFDYDDRKLKGKVPLGVAKTLAKLKKGGVEASWHVTSTRTACVVLLRATVHRLARYADDVDWPMPLDEAECARRAAAGDAEHGIKPFDIFHDPRVTRGLLCLLPSCISLLLSSPPLLVMLLLPPPLSLTLCLRLRLHPLTRLLLLYSMAIIVLTPLRNAFASKSRQSRIAL